MDFTFNGTSPPPPPPIKESRHSVESGYDGSNLCKLKTAVVRNGKVCQPEKGLYRNLESPDDNICVSLISSLNSKNSVISSNV